MSVSKLAGTTGGTERGEQTMSADLKLDSAALADVSAVLTGISSYIASAVDVAPADTGAVNVNQAILSLQQSSRRFGDNAAALLGARARQAEGIGSSFQQLDSQLGRDASQLGDSSAAPGRGPGAGSTSMSPSKG